MYCNKWTNSVLAIIIIVTVFWPSLLGATVSMWVAGIAALLVLLQSLGCKSTRRSEASMPRPKAAKKKRR